MTVANGDAIDREPTESRPLSDETSGRVLAALASRVPGAALGAVQNDQEIPHDIRQAIQEALEGTATVAEQARTIGDVLRSVGHGPVNQANEFYRASFYLSEEWAELSSNPMFAWFSANKAGQPMDKWIHYFPAYEKLLQRFVGSEARVLEIGVFHGGGLELLRHFLGPKVQLVGLDCDPSAQAACAGRFDVAVGDQANPEFLEAVSTEYGPFDVIIDDGGHTMSQQITSIETLFPLLRDGGIYLVEDTHTSYWGDYQDSPQTFLEWTKERVDDLHAYHHPGARSLSLWTTDVAEIRIFDSIVAIEKHTRYAPFCEVAGTGSALRDPRRQELDLLFYRAATDIRTAELDRTRAVQQEAMNLLSEMGETWSQERTDLDEKLANTLAELRQTQQALDLTHGDLQAMRTSTFGRMTTALRRVSRRFKT